MLILWRRHKPTCPHKADRYYRKCRCLVHVEGTSEGTYRRHSLKTRSWERATQLLKQLEDGIKPKEEKSITITQALNAFVRECEDRNLNSSTLRKYRRLSELFRKFVAQRAACRLSDVSVDVCRDFKNTWKLSPRTASKQLERLKSFFKFCVENGWIETSPAKHLKAPEIRPNPTLPFSDIELLKIFAAAEGRAATFFRVLLNSGLRIIDAAQLRPEKIIDGKVFLYTQKTGVPVMCPLPPDLLQELENIPLVGGFFFAVQSSNPVTIAEYYRVKLAKIDKSFHPHRFRDTFAINLLLKGVSIENVAILLGNTVRVCERHYSPWVLARQSALEKAVESTWGTTKLVRVK